ncbi:DUF3153 domain-containing protein [Marininema halotolerans]|nr:DUF3153 domain-containing protein [Marininema halotolerans]
MLMVCVSMIVFSGCVNADLHVDLNMDGSGTYRLKVLTNPLVADQLSSFRKTVEAEGYTVKPTEENGQKGWIAEKDVKNVAKEPPGQEWLKKFADEDATASAGVLDFLNHDQKKGPLTVKHHFLTSRITFRKNVDLANMSIDNPLAQRLIHQVNLNLTVSLPIKPDRNNADSISNDGKTLSWKIEPGEKNPIFIEADVPNIKGWLTLGGILLAVLLIGGVLIFWVLSKKKTSP